MQPKASRLGCELPDFELWENHVTIIFGNVEGTWRYMRHCDGGMRVLEMTGGLNKDEKLRGKSKNLPRMFV